MSVNSNEHGVNVNYFASRNACAGLIDCNLPHLQSSILGLNRGNDAEGASARFEENHSCFHWFDRPRSGRLILARPFKAGLNSDRRYAADLFLSHKHDTAGIFWVGVII